MKKLLAALTVLFVSALSFADDYINFTIPLQWGFYFQDGKSSSDGDVFEYIWSYGVTAEYFHTFSGSFGLGIKGGAAKCDVSLEFADDNDISLDAKSIGWHIAPTLGWATNGDGTKKKINLYPVIFERLSLTDVESTRSGVEVDDDKLVLTNYKFGASFSWQWGDDGIQNGLEFGFSLPWDGMLEFDGTKIGKDGYGFDFHLAYKLSVCIPKN